MSDRFTGEPCGYCGKRHTYRVRGGIACRDCHRITPDDELAANHYDSMISSTNIGRGGFL